MAILNKTSEEEVKRYKDFIDSYEGASLLQAYNWANVKKGWQSEYVYVQKEGKIVLAVCVLIRKFVFGKTVMYASRGPVGDINDIELVKLMLKDIDELAKKYKAVVFRFDPEVKYTDELNDKYKKAGFKIRNKGLGKDDLIQPRFNMVLEIKGKTEEEIFKGYSEKTRYNIRLAARKGVTVRYSRKEEDLKKFYELYRITGIRDKIISRSYGYFEDILKAFDANSLRIYLAEHDGETLSAAIAINYGKKVFYLYGASSNEKRNLMPNYLMQQEMIKWAVETKCSLYDFGGVFVFDKANGLFKFKEGFCRQEGVTEYIGEIDKVYSKFYYFLFTKVIPMFGKYKKVLAKIIKN